MPRLQRLTYAEVTAGDPALRTWQWPPRPAELQGPSAAPAAKNADEIPLLFVSHANEDALWCASLEKHAAQWERSGGVRLVHAQRLLARSGAEELERALDKAAVIVLLVSADYLASDACVAQATRAMARATRGEVRVVPVLVRACDATGAPFEGIEPLPHNKSPIAAWTDFDAAWTEVVRSLRETTLAA